MRIHIFSSLKMKAETFYKDGAESEDRVWLWGVPGPPKTETKAKALEAVKEALKVSMATKRRSTCHHPLAAQKGAEGSPNILERMLCRKTNLNIMTKLPSQPRRRQNTLCSLWTSRPTSTRSNRLRRSSMTLTWPRLINTLIGRMEVNVLLALDYDVLDVVNKIGII